MEKSIIETVKELIKTKVEALGVELYDVEYVKEGRDYFLRVLIDKNDESIDLDTCVSVSEVVSAILDEKDPISNEYLLEVTSPGVERPLKTLEQFKKAIEKYVLIDVTSPIEGYDQLVGTIKNVTEDGIELEIKIKTRVKVVNIAFDIIENAMTTVKI